jgi:hypothetical protein
METASLSVLDYAARYRERRAATTATRRGRTQIAKYTGPPYAYFVPQRQRDPVAAVELLRRLAFHGIRVSQLSAPVTAEGVAHAAGTWVVPMDQEFAETARQVSTCSAIPTCASTPDGPLEQPYDAAGWTLPFQMGVSVTALTTPMGDDLRAAMKPLGTELPANGPATPYEPGAADVSPFDSAPGVGFDTNAVAAAIVPPAGKVTGTGPALALDPAQNNTFAALNRSWGMGARVHYTGAQGAQGASGATGAQPRYVVTGLPAAQQDELVKSYALQAERVASPRGARELKRPRVGLYRPWMASMDEGWTRWMLERFGFEVVSLYPRDFRGGALADRIDALIIADEARGLLEGYAKGVVPPQFEGGIGDDGVRVIDAFVKGGGTLVCFNRATAFAIQQFGLPVKDVVAGMKRQEFFTGGSVMAVEATTTHPVMAGMPAEAAIFVDGSPAFETGEDFKGEVLARYQSTGSPLSSTSSSERGRLARRAGAGAPRLPPTRSSTRCRAAGAARAAGARAGGASPTCCCSTSPPTTSTSRPSSGSRTFLAELRGRRAVRDPRPRVPRAPRHAHRRARPRPLTSWPGDYATFLRKKEECAGQRGGGRRGSTRSWRRRRPGCARASRRGARATRAACAR